MTAKLVIHTSVNYNLEAKTGEFPLSTVTVNIASLKERLLPYLRNSLELSPQDAEAMLDHLIRCELAGKACHGLIRVLYTTQSGKFGPYAYHPSTEPELDKNGNVHIDGSKTIGYPLMKKVVDKACEQALKKGICLVTGVSVYPSGALGDWAQLACEQGMGVIIMGGSPARVSAPGGSLPLLGTNPICIGLPAEPYHFISDASTSAITHGELMLAKQNGTELPKGAAVNAEGQSTTCAQSLDPANDLGALQVVGQSHKSFALSMAIELLTSLGGGKPGSKKSSEHGIFCIFFDPKNFASAASFSSVLQNWQQEGTRIPGWNSQAFADNQGDDMTLNEITYEKLMKCSGEV